MYLTDIMCHTSQASEATSVYCSFHYPKCVPQVANTEFTHITSSMFVNVNSMIHSKQFVNTSCGPILDTQSLIFSQSQILPLSSFANWF